jgi:RNA polymerase sigma-70 factor (ECF subfamily)
MLGTCWPSTGRRTRAPEIARPSEVLLRHSITGMGPADEALVAAFQGGDYSAFDRLVERWERKIFGAVYRILGSEEDARDICQEAFLKAFRGLGGFRGQARFSSWLYQIALNLCRDRMRRRRGKVWISLDSAEPEDAERTAVASAPSALEIVEAQDLSRTVAAAVAALPVDQREVIVLKEYQDMTFQEIAAVLGVPLSTVKTRLYRGLGQLRQRLERDGVRGAAAVPAELP